MRSKAYVSAAQLRHQLQLMRFDPVTAYDQAGQPVRTYSCVSTLKAAIKPLTGREYWTASMVQADVTHEITMRYQQPLPTPKDRFQMSDEVTGATRTFEIISVLDVEERHMKLVIMAKERPLDE